MDNLQEVLNELYLNYDTIKMLQDDNNSTDEIIQLLKEEVEYSEELTETLMRLKKNYIRSVVMRIKIKMKKSEGEEIKEEILSHDNSLTPLLNKLIQSEKFAEEYNKINEVHENEKVVEEVDEVEQKVEQKVQENDEDDVEDNKSEEDSDLDYFLSNHVTQTDDEDDVLKISHIHSRLLEYSENTDNASLQELSKSELKKYLSSKWGKSVKSSYRGYKLN